MRSICTFQGCDRDVAGHGLCLAHYKQRRKGKVLTPIGSQSRRANMTLAEVVKWMLTNTTIDPDTGCLLWTKATTNGYAAVRFQGRTWAGNVLIARYFHGDAPSGMDACHSLRCGTRRHCINQEHIRWDTRKANLIDAAQLGRQAKISQEAVLAIDRDLRRGDRICDIASAHGVPQWRVKNIAYGLSWCWLTGRKPQSRNPVSAIP